MWQGVEVSWLWLQVSKNVEREIHNHRSLHHPHIIKFEEVILTEQHIGIAMEYAAGGDLFDFVVSRNGLAEDEARWFFQQLICAVDYMHHKGVVNRDIKLENSLLTNHVKPLLKICDFGYSKVTHASGGACCFVSAAVLLVALQGVIVGCLSGCLPFALCHRRVTRTTRFPSPRWAPTCTSRRRSLPTETTTAR
jgi:serine/threonine protein kinase